MDTAVMAGKAGITVGSRVGAFMLKWGLDWLGNKLLPLTRDAIEAKVGPSESDGFLRRNGANAVGEVLVRSPVSPRFSVNRVDLTFTAGEEVVTVTVFGDEHAVAKNGAYISIPIRVPVSPAVVVISLEAATVKCAVPWERSTSAARVTHRAVPIR